METPTQNAAAYRVCLLLRFLPKIIKYRSLSLNSMSGSFLRRTHTLRRSFMLAIPYTTRRWSASSRYPGHLGVTILNGVKHTLSYECASQEVSLEGMKGL